MRTVVHYGLATILLVLGVLTWRQSGMFSDNETLWRTTIALNPTAWMAHNNLGGLLLQKGQVDQAIAQYQQAVALKPNDAEAQYNLGKALLTSGSLQESIDCFTRALAIRPRSPRAEMELGQALLLQGQFAQAIGHYQTAIKLEPDNGFFLNNLAWLLATCPEAQFRKGNEAVQLAERACQLTGYQQPMLIGTLSAAYAEAGRFDDAIATSEKAYDLAFAQGHESLAAKDQELLQLFKARQPYREQLPPKPSNP
jgi:Flp pilus assembly protein TadD